MLNLQIDLKIGSVTFLDESRAKVQVLANGKALEEIEIFKNKDGDWYIQDKSHIHTMHPVIDRYNNNYFNVGVNSYI